MEGIGSEVSHKIRAAIKAKLIELGAYVDDELPDYIMVMVANKRTRTQMDEDLQLFLSSNTKVFTSWLHTVLQKLQEVTVASFENKKDSDSKKSSKHKKPEIEDGRSRKSSEEGIEKTKKHSKKHKEGKKAKKNKHKNKEKAKGRKSEKESSKEKSGKDDEKKTALDKMSKNQKVELNDAVGRAILGDLKKSKKLKVDNRESMSQASSSDDDTKLDKSAKENENGNTKPATHCTADDVLNINDNTAGADMESIKKNTKEVIEDEFNIEPLKPTEKDSDVELIKDVEIVASVKSKEAESNIEAVKNISAPTEELLKEHDKMQNEEFEGKKSKGGGEKQPKSDSEESLSPEEIRKQLLLSRAKKKLEESKKAERMRSNSPDVLIVEETCGGRQKDLLSGSSRLPGARSPRSSDGKGSSRTGSPHRSRHRSSVYSDRRSHSSTRSPHGRSGGGGGGKSKEERRKISLVKSGRSSPSAEKEGEKKSGGGGEKKKNVIRISESLQMEKRLGVKKDTEAKPKEKETCRKRPVSSRVVTITGPEAPEIPSIVKVKPREFISKDKQANKALILKAVADAEKSIATVHARPEIEPEPKKEALYTRNLREKRYEKLAITLSNIRRNARDRLERLTSAESGSERKRDSSDVSDGARMKSDLLSKKMSKSDDQFISSKTTIMEKNDKYIRCWLEGVERAVKEEEMINPIEMEDFVQSNFTDEENDLAGKEDEKKRKRKLPESLGDAPSKAAKLKEKEAAGARPVPESGGKEEEPQIVVTLDGLDTKAIKDLILKNKESAGRPLLSGTGKKPGEKSGEKKSAGRSGPEKMSDRFGRLNRANDEEPRKSEKKKPETGETEKKEKVKTESKNRQLIAQLSEKFGKVDREFENRKRKRPEEERRYESRRNDKDEGERNGRYRKSERRSFREGGFGFYRRS